MGRISVFLVGAVCGAHLAQSYKLPNVSTSVNWCVQRAQELEREYKKNNNGAMHLHDDGSSTSSSTGGITRHSPLAVAAIKAR